MTLKEIRGNTLKAFILSTLIILLAVPSFSQTRMGSTNIEDKDSLQCLRTLSTYKEFFNHQLYGYAMESWRVVFNDCPASSEKMYIDGVTMYRSFIEEASDGPVREGMIDTLMLIYDRRIEYFGGEGNVLGRKGRDLLNYRRADIEQVQQAYLLLKKSVELEGIKSKESVLRLFISSGISLDKSGKLDDNEVIEDYFLVVGILDQLEGKSTRWERSRVAIDEIMLKADILSCDALNRYFEPQFEQNKSDKAFLEKLISFYTNTGCYLSDIYETASENLYNMDPGPESAHNLAILFISKNEFPKAAGYLKLALDGENIQKETRAEWFFELSVVSAANKEYCEAIDYAREAIANRQNYGKAYMALGDAIVASRGELGDGINQRTSYWVATDMYNKAALADPSIASEANQKLTNAAGQYPSGEDVFFLDLKDGDSYLVGGCINEYTTVRERR